MMKKNMTEWINSIFSSEERKAMPIMTYPGLNILGKTVFEMVTDGEVQYESLKALSDRYPAVACATLVMALYVEAEAFGSKIKYSQNEIPTVSKRLIKSFSSVANMRIPEVGEGKTFEHLKAAKLAVENITDRPVFGGIIGPYSLAGRLYDITEMMAAILLEPEGSHELLKICTGFLKKYAQAFKDAGCNGIIIAEPAAGLLAGKECNEFSSYYVKQIVDHVQDENFIVILHNCGNTVNLVNSMVSTGSAGFHFGNAVNMLDILPQVPSDRLVFGNIDPVGVIKNCTPETIRIKTLELLNKTASFKNFVLSSGCDVPPGAKLENIDAFFNALNEYNEGQLKSIEADFSSYFGSELLEREVLSWDNSLSVA
ncbi:MAG: uroporphyrinogen decarboxylase family protein [Bacteroidales bacterium]|nr:uroporphyrinogen decarboxylase family protein [Bacteroidales bacterium]